MFGNSVVGCFADTGLEFPEIKDFIKTFENIEIVRPDMDFRTNIMKFGYPIISKDLADTVNGAKKNPNGVRMKKLNGSMKGKSKFDQSKWQYLLDAPFELNNKCCDIFKKKPMMKFQKLNGLYPIIGSQAHESQLREKNWVMNGCNAFKKGHEKSLPLSVWTEKDIYEYIDRFGLKLAKPYEMGYKRTGCIFCGFGVHTESKKDDSGMNTPNRYMMLKQTHPNLYAYMMKPKEQGGLGFKEPLEYIGIKVDGYQEQISIYDMDNDKK
jgi:3'-phosphoadenosine 5'-phosphosulfate sulfotransferase (PAPS reductase)/FAD synthetase